MSFFIPGVFLRRISTAAYTTYALSQPIVRPCPSKNLLIYELDTQQCLQKFVDRYVFRTSDINRYEIFYYSEALIQQKNIVDGSSARPIELTIELIYIAMIGETKVTVVSNHQMFVNNNTHHPASKNKLPGNGNIIWRWLRVS